MRVYGMNITQRKRLQVEIQASERKYRELVKYAPVGIYDLDFRTQKFISVNDAMCLLTGYRRDELLAMNPMELLDEKGRHVFQERIQKWLVGEKPDNNIEYHLLAKGAREIVAELNVTFTTGEGGKPVGATVIGHDITERKQMEKALRESESKFSLVFEKSAFAATLSKLPDGVFVDVNEAWEKIFGYTRKEALGKTSLELNINPDTQTRQRTLAQLQESGFVRQLEMALFTKSGDLRVFSTNIDLVDIGGEKYLLNTIQDITERKQAEDALQRKESELTEAQHIAHVGSWYWDAQTDVTTGSDELLRIYGLDPATQSMPNFRDQRGYLYPVDTWERLNAAVQKTVQTGLGYELDVEALHNGDPIWITTRCGVVLDAEGRIVGLRGTVQDITERRRAEKTLRENEDRYRKLIESMQEAIFLFEPVIDGAGKPVDMRYLEVNAAGERFLGKTRVELIGRTTTEALGGTVPESVEIVGRVALTGEPAHMEQYSARAGHWYESFNYSPQVGQVAMLAIDITECKKAEALLKETNLSLLQKSEELEKARIEAEIEKRRLEAVMEALPVGLSITDNQGGVLQTNVAFEQVWGGKPPVTQSVSDYVPYKAWWVDTGKEVAAEEWASAQVVHSGETVLGQMMEIQRFDGSLAHVIVSASPVRDVNGKIIGGAAAVQDITRLYEAERALQEANQLLEQRVRERTAALQRSTQELQKTNKELELAEEELSIQNLELEKGLEVKKSLRSRLIQAEKYMALARLVGSVAHEINNPLQTVQNCLYLLQPEIPPGELQDIMEMALSESRRIGILVQQLRETFWPTKIIQPVDFNLIEVLTKANTLLAAQYRQSNVQFLLHCENEAIILHGIPDQIQQVCLNIFINAIEAMEPKGGQLDIDVSRTQDLQKARISFHDTGPGIPEDNLSKIFEPFFTTKAKGTGLGLAICYEIVKNHAGEITVESQPGEGTTIIVWLPVG